MKTCPLSVREDILLSVHEDMSSVCIWRHVLSLYMKTCLLSVYGDMSSVCIWRHVFYLYMKTFLLSVYKDMSSVCTWRHVFCMYVKTCLLSVYQILQSPITAKPPTPNSSTKSSYHSPVSKSWHGYTTSRKCRVALEHSSWFFKNEMSTWMFQRKSSLYRNV